MRRVVTLLMAGACALAGAAGALPAQQPAAADTSLADLDLEQLARVRVTSVSRGPETVAQAMAAVFVVSREDIRRAGVTSLPEALRLAPGLQVVRLGAQNWSVTSRGFADFTTNKLLVLIDGRAIYSPLFAGVFWDSQLLPVDDIERIEVILGPGATLWGSNAVNGVINIITRPATSTTGALVALRSGTEEHVNASARYGLSLGARGAIRFYGTFLDREPIELADGTDGQDAWQSGSGGFRLDLDAGARDRFTLQGDAYDASSRQLGREALPDPPFARQVVVPTDLQGMDALARWTRQTSERSELQVQAYFDRSIRSQPQVVGRTDVNIADLELQHRIVAGQRHTILWGAGYRFADGELQGTFTTSLSPAQRTTHLVTAFLRDEIALVPDRWTLAVGSKIEWNSYTGAELQPGIRLRWSPSARHTVWGALSRSVRTPSRLDTDVRFIAGAVPTSPPTYIRIQGNPDFESERLIESELGYRGELSAAFAVDLSAYYGWYDRLRSTTPQAAIVEDGQPIQPILLTNLARGHSAGGTAAVIWRPLRPLQIRANYTFLDIADSVVADAPAGTTANLNPGFSPEHQAGLSAYASLPGGLEAWVGGRYVSPLRNPRVPPYAEMSARLGWAVTPSLTLAVTGQDLLHRRHAEFAGGNAVPRRAGLHVTWRF